MWREKNVQYFGPCINWPKNRFATIFFRMKKSRDEFFTGLVCMARRTPWMARELGYWLMTWKVGQLSTEQKGTPGYLVYIGHEILVSDLKKP